MSILKCKMCGGDLVVEPGSTVAECEYCGSKQTIPSQDDDKKLTLFARANRLRMGSEFDKAAGIYESIVAEFPEEAEAYWGLVLCKYGIEYVDDPATGKKIPTCHRSSFDSVMEDTDFEQAMENADVIARRVYREEAKAIEEIRKGIIEVSGKEEPYDIFICYKETTEDGNRTIDSVIAQDVYDALTDKGYRVFFSRITLEDKLGQEYEPYIFAALNSAKIMLAFGTDYEYYNAVWVKNEWSRYLKLMAKDKTKYLIPCYKNIDAYDMPKEFAKLQAQDMGKLGAVQDLLRGIEKILGGKKVEETATSGFLGQQVFSGPNVATLLDRGFMSLEDGAFDEAKGFFDDALNTNSKCAEAYLGLFMADIQVGNWVQVSKLFVAGNYAGNRYWQRTKQFADKALKAKMAELEQKHAERVQREAEEARLQKEHAEQAARERKALKEEAERKRKQEIALIRDKINTGSNLLSQEKQQELNNLLDDAKIAEETAEKEEAAYHNMLEHEDKKRIEKELQDKKRYFNGLSIFQGREKKLIQEQIQLLEKKLYRLEEAINEKKIAVESTKYLALQAKSNAENFEQREKEKAKKELQIRLLELDSGLFIAEFLQEASKLSRMSELYVLWNKYKFDLRPEYSEQTKKLQTGVEIERMYGVDKTRVKRFLETIK